MGDWSPGCGAFIINWLLFGVNCFCLSLGISTPKEEHNSFALIIDEFDHLVGEVLPSALGVRVRFIVFHCKSGIEQEHSLFGPFC